MSGLAHHQHPPPGCYLPFGCNLSLCLLGFPFALLLESCEVSWSLANVLLFIQLSVLLSLNSQLWTAEYLEDPQQSLQQQGCLVESQFDRLHLLQLVHFPHLPGIPLCLHLPYCNCLHIYISIIY